MAITTFQMSGILRPEEVGALIVQPVERESVAFSVASKVDTASGEFRIPLVTADTSAAWTEEGADIAESAPTISELVVRPTKLAALSGISNELANDSSPASADVVGGSIARDLARKIDQAFFGNTIANGPSGLLSLANVQHVTAASILDLDPFSEAVSLAENVGGQITAWCANATTVLALSRLKESTGSNRPLLQPDPTLPTRRQVLGVPLYSLPDTVIGEGVIWGIPRDRVYVVARTGVTLEVDSSWFFGSDSLAVRATMRIGFGFPHQQAIVKIGSGGS